MKSFTTIKYVNISAKEFADIAELKTRLAKSLRQEVSSPAALSRSYSRTAGVFCP